MNQSLHGTGIQLQLRHQPLHQPVMRSETGRHGGEKERIVYGNFFGRRGSNFTGTWWTAVPPQLSFWYETPKPASAAPSMSHCVCLFFFLLSLFLRLWEPRCGIRPLFVEAFRAAAEVWSLGGWTQTPGPARAACGPLWGDTTVCCSIVPGRIVGKEGRDTERRKTV